MKIKLCLCLLMSVMLLAGNASAIELTDSQGGYKSKLMDGRMYDDRGKYIGMITERGRMYDKDGHFIGQIRGFIRDGKLYGPDGEYRGQIKR